MKKYILLTQQSRLRYVFFYSFDSHFGGVRDVAKNIGLGSQITVKLARLDKSDSRGAQCFAINTDDQVALELPSIRTGTDMLQRKWLLSAAAVYRVHIPSKTFRF